MNDVGAPNDSGIEASCGGQFSGEEFQAVGSAWELMELCESGGGGVITNGAVHGVAGSEEAGDDLSGDVA